jgi:hypothetical protein
MTRNLSNFTYASANAGANVTAVTAVSNINGIHVSQIIINSSNTGTCGFSIGANDVAILNNGNVWLTDFIIPAGVDFILKSSTANNKVMAYYEIL